MDNKDFLKLVEMLEKESSARIAAERTKAAEIAALSQIISDQNASFGQRIQDLNVTIGQLNETIGRLLEENRLLKGPKKNSGNSSIPPSKDENRPQRTGSLRASGGKSSGGQKGHEGSTLEMSATPDDIIEHRPGFCSCCGLNLDGQHGELASRRQVVDIPVIRPSYTEHRIFRKTCTCGHITKGTYPLGVGSPISYGQQTTALIAYLHTRQYIPLARISEFFCSVYGMGISQGTVCGILDRFADKARPAFALIKQAVSGAKVIGADETGMKENGRLNWFWTWQSKFATYITASKNRGLETVKANFPSGFPKAILLHDCWPSHLNTPAAGHQICTAHLLRELLFFKQKYQCSWAAQFSLMTMQAIQLKKIMKPSDYGKPLKARAEIEALLDELIRQEISPDHPEVTTFRKRIIKHRNYILTFLYNLDVPSHNNSSEQAIRNIKVKLKVSGMFKSSKGAQNYAIIRSITDTCKKNQQDILNAFSIIATA